MVQVLTTASRKRLVELFGPLEVRRTCGGEQGTVFKFGKYAVKVSNKSSDEEPTPLRAIFAEMLVHRYLEEEHHQRMLPAGVRVPKCHAFIACAATRTYGIVTDWIEGDVARSSAVVESVSKALHESGLPFEHGDLHRRNIVVNDADGVLNVLDWGSAVFHKDVFGAGSQHAITQIMSYDADDKALNALIETCAHLAEDIAAIQTSSCKTALNPAAAHSACNTADVPSAHAAALERL